MALIKTSFFGAALLLALAAAFLFPHRAASDTYSSNPTSHDEIQAPVPDALDRYLETLSLKYECTGLCAKSLIDGTPYRRVDSNSLYSYGCLQFQERTYLSFAKEHSIDPWANGGIYNCENQKAIAKAMFLEDVEAASMHWFTSIYTRGLGLPPG